VLIRSVFELNKTTPLSFVSSSEQETYILDSKSNNPNEKAQSYGAVLHKVCIATRTPRDGMFCKLHNIFCAFSYISEVQLTFA